MTRSPEMPDLDLCEAISRLLHTTLITAHTQNAKLFTKDYRHWLETGSQEAQIAKIAAFLQKTADVPALLNAIDHILGKFFIPAFQGSKAHSQVLQRVQGLIAAKVAQPAPSSVGEIEQVEDSHGKGEHGNSLNSGWAGLYWLMPKI